jgi:rare lipoprotein A (peptidoglycan hydrolase)
MKTALAAVATAVFMAVFVGKAEAESALSSWYGPGFEGSATASGEVYGADAYTAAHPSLPFGTELLVTYGGRQMVVKVADRGPFSGDRDLDLSQAAAEHIGLTATGTDAVDVRVLTNSDSQEYSSSSGYAYASRKEHDRGAAFLRKARPYFKALGAMFRPYSRLSTKVCREFSAEAPCPPCIGRSFQKA